MQGRLSRISRGKRRTGLTGGSSTRVCARGGGRERTDRVVRVACAAHRAASATAGE